MGVLSRQRQREDGNGQRIGQRIGRFINLGWGIVTVVVFVRIKLFKLFTVADFTRLKMRGVKADEATLSLLKVITSTVTRLWRASMGPAVRDVAACPLGALALSSRSMLLGACWGIASEITAVFLLGALLAECWGISVDGGRGEE